MGAALGRGDGVAVGVEKSVLIAEPGESPFDRAVPAGPFDLAGEDVRRDPRATLDAAFQKVLEAAREMERGFGGRVVAGIDQLRRAGPADLDAAEEIRLGAMRNRRSGLNRALGPKISGSGRKRTLVPRRLWTAPRDCKDPSGTPRAKH